MTIQIKISPNVKEEKVETEEEYDPIEFYISEAQSKHHKDRTTLMPDKGKDDFVAPDAKILASSINSTDTFKRYNPYNVNSFVDSAYGAYSFHHNWEIKPDDVWIAILVQFSLYVNANAETLRDKLVNFQGKKLLEVETIGTLLQLPVDDCTMAMADLIARNIKDASIRDWVIPSFTTTTSNDRMAGAIALMSTLQKFFHYSFHTRCGIPSVTLHGEVSDWENIRTRANRLIEFDAGDSKMQEWSSKLLPVLDNFVQSAKGSPDVDWWGRIISRTMGSGVNYLDGWMTVFCVFDSEGKWKALNTYSSLGSRKVAEWYYVEKAPRGFVSTPLLLKDNGTNYNAELYAGHMSFTLPTPTTLSPKLDWFLVYNPKPDDGSNPLFALKPHDSVFIDNKNLK